MTALAEYAIDDAPCAWVSTTSHSAPAGIPVTVNDEPAAAVPVYGASTPVHVTSNPYSTPAGAGALSAAIAFDTVNEPNVGTTVVSAVFVSTSCTIEPAAGSIENVPSPLSVTASPESTGVASHVTPAMTGRSISRIVMARPSGMGPEKLAAPDVNVMVRGVASPAIVASTVKRVSALTADAASPSTALMIENITSELLTPPPPDAYAVA